MTTIAWREIDLIRVKGKLEPLPVFEVRGSEDEPVSSHEAQLLASFAGGLASYRARAWGQALGYFEDVLTLDPTDEPSRQFRARVRHYLAHEPAGDWDGVWTLTEK